MCRWSDCSATALFAMVAGGDEFLYCADHIRPAVEDFRLDGPPVEVKVFRRPCYLCGGRVHPRALANVCDDHH